MSQRFQSFSKTVAVLFASATLALAQNPLPATAVVPDDQAHRVISQPSADYKLLPKDTVHIKVFQEEDLETTARIDVDGNIFFPVLGKAHIGGQTVQSAINTLTSLLDKYLVNPQVSMEITSYARQHFTMLGQVNKPGIFDFPDEGSVNFLEAIGMAGGYTKIANPHWVTITRMVDGHKQVIKVDGKKELLKMQDNSAPVIAILPGDTINVGEGIL